MARFLKTREHSNGAAPGSVIFLGRKKTEKTTFRLMRFNVEGVSDMQNVKKEQLQHLSTDSVNWINVYGLHDVEKIKTIGALFSIPHLILEDVVNTDHRPKIVEFDGGLLIIVKAFFYNNDDKKIHTDQISFVVGANYLICFQEKSNDYFNPVRQRIQENIGRIRRSGHDYLLYALIDTLIDNTLVLLEKIGNNIEALESHIPRAEQKLALTIYQYKNEITYLRKSVRPYKEIVYALSHSSQSIITDETQPYVDDLYELINQTIDATEVYYSMVQDQLSLYNTYVNNKANEIMKFLTMFASIFIPLTFLAGIYGTNFDYLPELHFKYSYFIMWGVMCVVAAVMLVYFKIKRWI